MSSEKGNSFENRESFKEAKIKAEFEEHIHKAEENVLKEKEKKNEKRFLREEERREKEKEKHLEE